MAHRDNYPQGMLRCILVSCACAPAVGIIIPSGIIRQHTGAPRSRCLVASDDAPALGPAQLAALIEVSQCLKQCGNTKTPFGSPRSFYNVIYSPGDTMGDWKDPSAEDWEAIRAEWPELSGVSDELMASQLPTLRANQPDKRSLGALELNKSGPHSSRAK